MNERLIFYVFFAITLVSALGVIFSKHIVRSVLWLIAAFIFTSVLWLLLKIEFLAFLLVLIYVGAVLVLFTFVILLFDLNQVQHKKHFNLVSFCGVIFAGTLLGIVSHIVIRHGFPINHGQLLLNTIPKNELMHLCHLIFNNHILAVEISGLLLIATIVIALGLNIKGNNT